MSQNRGALDVAQEVQPQSLAFAGAGDKARNVGDGENLVAEVHHTQVGNQSRKWVVRDLWLSCGEHGNQ